jgi:hypothetical protein
MKSGYSSYKQAIQEACATWARTSKHASRGGFPTFVNVVASPNPLPIAITLQYNSAPQIYTILNLKFF